MSVYENLKEHGIELPKQLAAAGLYKPVNQAGNLVFISGQGSMVDDTKITGRVGADLSVDEGAAAARICAINTLAALEAAQLLVLDDLGTECLSPYTASCLYSLVNTRVCRRLPTIYTTNIVRDEDLQRRYTEKLVSRLLGSCEMLAFCGEDIRLQGK